MFFGKDGQNAWGEAFHLPVYILELHQDPLRKIIQEALASAVAVGVLLSVKVMQSPTYDRAGRVLQDDDLLAFTYLLSDAHLETNVERAEAWDPSCLLVVEL